MTNRNFRTFLSVLSELDLVIHIKKHGATYQLIINYECVALYRHRVSAKERVLRQYGPLAHYFSDYFNEAIKGKLADELARWAKHSETKSPRGRKYKKAEADQQLKNYAKQLTL